VVVVPSHVLDTPFVSPGTIDRPPVTASEASFFDGTAFCCCSRSFASSVSFESTTRKKQRKGEAARASKVLLRCRKRQNQVVHLCLSFFLIAADFGSFFFLRPFIGFDICSSYTCFFFSLLLAISLAAS
jgi:predicted MFS family arabinose efflux permease